jgi:hypothetical protein
MKYKHTAPHFPMPKTKLFQNRHLTRMLEARDWKVEKLRQLGASQFVIITKYYKINLK